MPSSVSLEIRDNGFGGATIDPPTYIPPRGWFIIDPKTGELYLSSTVSSGLGYYVDSVTGEIVVSDDFQAHHPVQFQENLGKEIAVLTPDDEPTPS